MITFFVAYFVRSCLSENIETIYQDRRLPNTWDIKWVFFDSKVYKIENYIRITKSKLFFSAIHFYNHSGFYVHPVDAYIEDGLAQVQIFYDLGIKKLSEDQATGLKQEEIADMVSLLVYRLYFLFSKCYLFFQVQSCLHSQLDSDMNVTFAHLSDDDHHAMRSK